MGSSPPCARSSTPKPIRRRRRSLPRTRSCISDPDLLEIAESAIAKGKSAAFAWKKAVATHADRLAALRNELLAQRANDLRDVGRRVLSLLTGVDVRQPVYPAELRAHRGRSHAFGRRSARPLDASWDSARRAAAPLRTSPSSPGRWASRRWPASIRRRSRCRTGPSSSSTATTGRCSCTHRETRSRVIRRAQERSEQRRRENLSHALEPAITLDGVRVDVLANIGGLEDASRIAATWRRRRRAAALGVPLHGSARCADRRAAVRNLQGHRGSRSGPGGRSSSGRWMWAATSH